MKLVDSLRKDIAAVRSLCLPAKKFSFKRKKPRKAAAKKAPTPLPVGGTCASHTAAAAPLAPAVAAAEAAAAPPAVEAAWQLDDQHSVRHVADMEVLVCGACDRSRTRPLEKNTATWTCLCKGGGEEATGDEAAVPWVLGDEFQVSDVRAARVFLQGRARMVRVTDVHEAEVYIGPVAGSVMLMRCSNSKFHFAAHQCRIHTSTNCEYHIATRSNPIMEDCTGLGFAAFDYDFPGIEEDLKVSFTLSAHSLTRARSPPCHPL